MNSKANDIDYQQHAQEHRDLFQDSDSPFIQERPSSYGALACISTFLCFCPVGLAALFYSCRARFAKDEGNFAEARTLGRNARDIAVASLILGIFLILVAVLIVVLLWQTVGFKRPLQ
ncbi:hypothetical protein C0Q70_04986 [Pomacea canaliculata]|uniref:Uncharacterized protein n=1 Tax=Pomacea canaliculata TaxID=400727 RepID=A0A2T7PJW2_POMCA|nr:hypothetical protein C0Q70_04986 [Pomacea canaliculata]